MYSFIGVNAINTVVIATNKMEKIPPKTNTFNRDNFNENRSSKVFSFKTTNLYLSVSFCFKLPFLVFATAFCLLFYKYTTRK